VLLPSFWVIETKTPGAMIYAPTAISKAMKTPMNVPTDEPLLFELSMIDNPYLKIILSVIIKLKQLQEC